MSEIDWNDFQKVEMRVGSVIKVEDFPEAKNPAFKMWIDFGATIGIKKTSAQVTKRYNKEDLLNRQVIAVVNFPKKQIANFMSECLVIGAVGEDNDVTLLSPDYKVENGIKIG
ncbi:tRNA-binding protein [Galbibacter mesophilus]|uniref:tRNA-binding protein n=1 Tax=Galbibacter mesophilus TaxID=379069 RepID=UPI00191DF0FC|nr:tRNA-binding protein [Galbibacter mesophilus]MCM5663918.1 tRNA-binding protein [Galbibacter mesophilus]